MAKRLLGLVVLILLMSGSATACAPAPSEAGATVRPDSVRSLLPPDGARVQVMELAAPPRLEALTQQFREAISQDPEWMQQYVAEADLAPGEPLPFHPNMGLSQDEYDEMQRLFNEMVLTPVRDADLAVTQTDGGLRLDGEPDLPGLSGISFDPDGATVRTPFAVLSGAERVSPNEDQTITGPWTGLSWWHEDVDPATGNGVTVSLDLGRLEESGDGLLYYDARRIENGALVERVKWTLTYPLAAR